MDRQVRWQRLSGSRRPVGQHAVAQDGQPGHYALTNKKDGKTVVTGTVELSTDNKSRTLTTEMTDAAGKKQTSIAVYDRQ